VISTETIQSSLKKKLFSKRAGRFCEGANLLEKENEYLKQLVEVR
jgi:hypothetical protein